MKIDLRAAEFPTTSLRAEVCIVGAGIAGLVLAQALVRSGIDVLLIEAGGPGAENVHRLEDGPAPRVEMLGHPHPGSLEGAPRALGGSSLTWGGQLLPLPRSRDRIEADSAVRRALPAPGSPWPLPEGSLERFQRDAERLLGVNDLAYDADAFFQVTGSRAPSFLTETPWLTPRLSKFAPYTHRNLAQTLGHELLAHPTARVLLHASVTELRLAPDGSARLGAAILRTPAGEPLAVEADHFVLAAGTLETVRLLLASRRAQPAGLGNAHDQLGRGVHDHLTLTAATFAGAARASLLTELRPWVFPGPGGSVLHSLKLESSASGWVGAPVMAHLTLEEPPGSGIEAVRSLLHARQQQTSTSAGLRDLLPRLPAALRSAVHLTWSARVQHRRFVSPQALVSLRLNAAQSSPSDSRITLSALTDVFGEPLPALRWNISPQDCATLRAFATGLLRQTRLGEFKPQDMVWTPPLLASELDNPGDPELKTLLTDARHLMGGAIMGTDPRSSVVDADLQVHGTPNLHIASLATFPDGRAQLPTLTLMALALRLAERLASRLGR